MAKFEDIEAVHDKLVKAKNALEQLGELWDLDTDHIFTVVLAGIRLEVPEVTFGSFLQTAEAFLHAEIEELSDKLRQHGIEP